MPELPPTFWQAVHVVSGLLITIIGLSFLKKAFDAMVHGKLTYWAGFDNTALTWIQGFVAQAAINNGNWPAAYNLATVAALIVDSALSRKESRGLHYTLDYPEKNDREYVRSTLLSRI